MNEKINDAMSNKYFCGIDPISNNDLVIGESSGYSIKIYKGKTPNDFKVMDIQDVYNLTKEEEKQCEKLGFKITYNEK